MPPQGCALTVEQATVGWSVGHQCGAVLWQHQLGAAALELLEHCWSTSGRLSPADTSPATPPPGSFGNLRHL